MKIAPLRLCLIHYLQNLLWREIPDCSFLCLPWRAQSPRKATLLPFVVMACLLAGCQPRFDVSDQVELVTDFENPRPAATFEVRFDQPVARAGQIGVPLTDSPLVFSPPLPGQFAWLSPRSGTFTPTQALAMDTRYTIALAPGLQDAKGHPLTARLRKTLRTPPFTLAGFLPAQGSTNASAEPELKLVFNAAVHAGPANHFLEFRDSRNRRVTAEVRQGTLEELPSSYQFGGDISLRTWNEQFADRQPGDRRNHLRLEEQTVPATNTVPNFLIVSTQHPLPIGNDWKLVIDAGMPSAENGLRLRQTQAVSIGDVTPFTFQSATSRNGINHSPTITLEFSKPLAQSLTNGVAAWVAIDPCPTNMETQLRGRALVLQGRFKSDRDYTITLRASLSAAEPFTLGKSQSLKVTVPRVKPRLYFPAFANEQLAQGQRSIPLLAVNVPKVHVRAKLLDPQTAIHALRGYGSYFRSWNERESWEEPFRRVDYKLVPGRTVFDEVLSVTTETDIARHVALDWDRLLRGRKTGLVFLEAERPNEDMGREERLGTQALIQLTDLGVIWKNASSQHQAFVFSHSTGQPVAGATVKLLTEENELLCQAATSSNGLVQLPLQTNAQWLAVQLGEDFHALEIRKRTVPLYAFHLPTAEVSDADDSRRILLFTDRELYRPGETAHFKALVRDWSGQGLSIPEQLSGTLICTDPRGRKFFETNLVFSPFGSCAAAVPLRSETRGSYSCVLRVGRREYFHSLLVQDYQPSAFEIALPAKPAYGPGEKLEVPLSARYFFGKPLSRAQVKWSLQAQDTEFRPEAFDSFAFGRSAFESRFNRGPASITLDGEDKLASGVSVVIRPELPLNPTAPQPRAASLLVEVTDVNQQTLSRQVEFIQHSSEFYLGLKHTSGVQGAGKELPVEVLAVGRDGKPWPQPVTVQAKLQRIEWHPVRIKGAGRSIRFRNEAILSNIAERVVQLLPTQAPAESTNVTSGTSVPGMVPLQAGQYIVEASTTDPDGRPVVSSLEFTVSAREQLAWDYHNDVQMSLKPGQAVYAPGETAEILMEAPFSGFALVTVERERILRSFTVPVEGNAPVIRVPIESADVPNLFISVTLVRGSEACPRQVKEPEYRLGYCQLIVKAPQHQLVVSVSPVATNCLPAQPVTITVDVKDSRGTAASEAEVTLYAVDEGVLSLYSAGVPEPYAFFYAPRPLGVQSGISLPNLLEENPEELRFSNKGYLGGGGGCERVRKNFLACAFWNASLRTDANGRVQATFPAPDSLTRYRVLAVAHTRSNQFGTGQSAFQVSKPLVVEPALPRFANIGDKLQARAVVLNQTARAAEVEVTLQLDSQARLTEPTTARRVSVQANGSAFVEFPLEFIEAGVARWTWRSRFADEPQGGFADAVQSTLPVGYPAPLLREILLARSQNEAVNLLAKASPHLLAGNGTITVELANTRLIGLGESIARLLHYPYGCAEQTGSSLLPWIVWQDQSPCRELLSRGTNSAEKAIQAGVARLFSMQTQSGGLGYWPRAHEPMLWASAYGGLVLALGQRHGVLLPQEDFARVLGYLSAQLRATVSSSTSLDDLCLAAYTLAVAGRAEPAYHEKLFNLRAQISQESRALLALAISESQGAREMVDELLASTAAGPRANANAFGCPARQKAISLLVALSSRPGDAKIDTLVTDLMNEQREGQWTTTQGNAWANLALSEYARRSETTLEPCSGELHWGTETIPFRLEGTNNVLSHTFSFAPPKTSPALKLASTRGTLFASTTIAARPPVTLQPRVDRGFSLHRRYQRLNDENQAEDIKALRVGDRVLVTLRLEVGQRAQFVALDDALPSNLEAINPEFKSQQTRGGIPATSSGFEEGDYWSSDFQEIRADRMLFFSNAVEPGHYLLRYVARVRAAATATAPAAKVEEMYHPDRYGLSEAQGFSTQPME